MMASAAVPTNAAAAAVPAAPPLDLDATPMQPLALNANGSSAQAAIAARIAAFVKTHVEPKTGIAEVRYKGRGVGFRVSHCPVRGVVLFAVPPPSASAKVAPLTVGWTRTGGSNDVPPFEMQIDAPCDAWLVHATLQLLRSFGAAGRTVASLRDRSWQPCEDVLAGGGLAKKGGVPAKKAAAGDAKKKTKKDGDAANSNAASTAAAAVDHQVPARKVRLLSSHGERWYNELGFRSLYQKEDREAYARHMDAVQKLPLETLIGELDRRLSALQVGIAAIDPKDREVLLLRSGAKAPKPVPVAQAVLLARQLTMMLAELRWAGSRARAAGAPAGTLVTLGAAVEAALRADCKQAARLINHLVPLKAPPTVHSVGGRALPPPIAEEASLRYLAMLVDVPLYCDL